MRSFLSSTLGKIILGLIIGGAVGIAVALGFALLRGVRVIVVESCEGDVLIKSLTSDKKIHEGQHLVDGDKLLVDEDSDVTLLLDSDKYVYGDSRTRFDISAKGVEGKAKTKFKVHEGTALFRIDETLDEGEYFTVELPNCILTVHGTVFRVSCDIDEDGECSSTVEVFEGEVGIEPLTIRGRKTKENMDVSAGERIILNTDKEGTEYYSGDNDENTLPIDYRGLSEGEVDFLETAIDGGRSLNVSKELLLDYAGINDHVFDGRADEIPATYDSEGSYYPVCSVCGYKSEERVTIPRLQSEDTNDATEGFDGGEGSDDGGDGDYYDGDSSEGSIPWKPSQNSKDDSFFDDDDDDEGYSPFPGNAPNKTLPTQAPVTQAPKPTSSPGIGGAAKTTPTATPTPKLKPTVTPTPTVKPSVTPSPTPTPTTFVVTFKTSDGKFFAGQNVVSAGYAKKPVFQPTTNGAWIYDGKVFDFANTPIKADITIEWKEQ